MAKKNKAGKAIEKRRSPLPAKTTRTWTIGALEAALLKEFPAEDAESWDRTGLTVGERALPATRVALALDPTVAAIEDAARAGADVLVTHHPAYLAAPDAFAPEPSVAVSAGAGVFAAVRNRVALMDFHTALDVSERAQAVLPAMLGLAYTGEVAVPIASSERKGYGQICRVAAEGGLETLAHLAARAVSVFGRAPRVWGAFDSLVSTVVCATGSAKNMVGPCVRIGADCLVCGELGYHDALALRDAGVSVVELGHDVSELPLVAVLAETLAHIGFPSERIVMLDQSGNWAYPEAVRI